MVAFHDFIVIALTAPFQIAFGISDIANKLYNYHYEATTAPRRRIFICVYLRPSAVLK